MELCTEIFEASNGFAIELMASACGGFYITDVMY